MIPIKEIPKSGIIEIIVYFKGYKGSYQNDTRRYLGESSPRIKEPLPKLKEIIQLEIDLKPLQFFLLRLVGGKKTRANGALYQYTYRNMSPEKFKILYREIKNFSKRFEWWEEIDVMISQNVGGLDEN
jgi:hypothetical protein